MPPSQVIRRAVIGVAFEAGKLLAIRRSEFVVAPGKLCFPGGSIEAGETAEQAIIRECNEELGIQVEPLERIWMSCSVERRVELDWWKIKIPHKRFQINRHEVENTVWLTPKRCRPI